MSLMDALNGNVLARKLIYFFITFIFISAVGVVVYVHANDVNTIVENKLAIKANGEADKNFKEATIAYMAEDLEARKTLTKELTNLTLIVAKLTEVTIRLDEKSRKP